MSSTQEHTRAVTAPQLAEGRKLFAVACAGCHTLTGHDTHADGGDLGLLQLTRAQLLSFARIMPIPPMRGDKLRTIASYVARIEADDAKLRGASTTASP